MFLQSKITVTKTKQIKTTGNNVTILLSHRLP